MIAAREATLRSLWQTSGPQAKEVTVTTEQALAILETQNRDNTLTDTIGSGEREL